MKRKHESDVAASAVSNADEFAQIVAPRRRRRKSASSSPPWLMWLLGVVAVVLMAIGVAAPQVTYALDADRYDEYVAELGGLRTELVDADVQAQAEEILFAEQVAEARSLVPTLESLTRADPLVLPKEQTKQISVAAAALKQSVTDTVADPASREQKRLDKTIADGRAVAPVSWLGATSAELIAVAGLEPDEPRPVESEATVSLDALEDVRRWVREDREELDALQARAAESERKSQGLRDTADASFGAVLAAAAALPQSADRLIADELPNIEPEQLDELRAAARDTAGVAASEKFVRFADGRTVPEAQAGGALPEGAALLPASEAARAKLSLGRFQNYVKLADAALKEQREYDEQVEAEEAARAEEEARRAEEEAAREEERNRNTENPTTEEPPVVDPPSTPQPPVVPPPTENPDDETPSL